MSGMFLFRRNGFVKSSDNLSGDSSPASTTVLTKKSKRQKESQNKSVEGGEGEFESQGLCQLSVSFPNGVQLAKIGVFAFLFLFLCTESSIVLVTKRIHFHCLRLRKGLEVFGYNIQAEQAHKTADSTMSTCTEDQPLVWGKENILDADTFEATRRCLTNHPMLEEKYSAADAGAHGFAVHFLETGVERFMSETRYNCGGFNPLIPFFKAARRADANGFVLQALACDSSWNSNAACLDTHLDDNVYHNKTGSRFLAHAVSVVYVSVPSDIHGGDLQLFGNRKTGSVAETLNTESPREAELLESEAITPVENMLVEFRGDSWHRVQGYSTETLEKRISLVLEQYKFKDTDEHHFSSYYEDDFTGSALDGEEEGPEL